MTAVLYNFLNVYNTQRIVKIPSRVLKGVFLLWTGIVLIYLIGYAIWWNGGYQRRCTIRSRVLNRVEGALIIKSSDKDIGVPNTELRKFWDHHDVVLSPSTDSGGFFVLTNIGILPNQTLRACPSAPPPKRRQNGQSQSRLRTNTNGQDYGASEPGPVPINTLCNKDNDCPVAGHFLPDGITTGRCVATTSGEKTCEIFGWCPVQPVILPYRGRRALLEDTQEFISVIENDIEFPGCGQTRGRKNYYRTTDYKYRKYLSECIFKASSEKDRYCPRFRLGDIVELAGANYSQVALTGGIFTIRITWNCSFDWGNTIDDCVPVYSFHRGNENQASLLGLGSIFSTVIQQDEYHRTARRNFGIRFIIDVQGEGRRFDFVTLSLTIGAGVGLLGFAMKICDALFEMFCVIQERIRWSWLAKYKLSMKYDSSLIDNEDDGSDGHQIGLKTRL